ncbi:hypothetical protein [Kitasatospora sp. NPDC001527]|uniref:hypothetical protein n=1 Tax=Kitasatospora sp. NPDC001527 TaxID=3154519 RepID=UPI0033236F59
MPQHTPDQPQRDDHDDEDLVFPALGALPPAGPPEQDERPDMIWHRPQPRSRLRDVVPGRLAHHTGTALVLAALGALAVVVVLLLAVGPYVLAAARWLLDPANVAHPAAEVWHTVDDPIHRSLTERGQGLPAGPGTLYGAWAATGLLILWRALRTAGSAGAQLGALAFGAVTCATVWDGTAGPGRPVAAGLVVVLWGALVAFALTGSWITTHTTVINEAAKAPSVTVEAPAVAVAGPEPRIETVLVVDRDGRRTSRPDDDQH